MYIELRFSITMEKGERSAYSQDKKNDRQRLENYRPISLLPVCGKILEGLVFDEIFPFFIKIDLISQNQSGFKPGDSCVNQLLYKSFVTNF